MGKETRFTRKNSQKQSCFLRSSCILFHKTWRSCFNGTSMQTVELKNTLQHDFRMNLFSVGLDGVNWQLTNSQDILNLQKKTSFNNDINWFWLINYASIISGVMKSYLKARFMNQSVISSIRRANTIATQSSIPSGSYWFSYDVIRYSVYLLSNRTQ